ncbi:MAG: flagellin, partial [Alphaproteobacteria bacterium]|nr:flagellin [Alphaproteobacteria bacterium]
YNLIIEQYNSLMGDAAYKGINLLDGQNLKINFNEDRSSKIEVAGVKADSESLGLKTNEWKTAEDIEKSVSELEEAIGSLRSFASEFGNYYSIVTTRQDFTENLINVLEEGADKLTLADMNQESANMLALQTAQQLAVNSLSLASQASQSILKLF